MTGAWEDAGIIEFMKWLKGQGFDHLRLFISTRRSLRLVVQGQSLIRHECGDSKMYVVEAAWNGEYCCAYTNCLKEDTGLIRQLRETAGIYPDREIPHEIAESKDFREQRWHEADRDAVIDGLRCAERDALACEKAHFVESCEYHQYEETVTLLDEQMHYLADDDGGSTFTIRVAARDEGFVAAASKYGIVDAGVTDNFKKTACELAKRAAEDARIGLHAVRMKSGTYPIVIANCVMAEITGHYLPMFYGENLIHRTSALAGKEHTQIGCGLLRMEEDPFGKEGTRRRRIDDEGVPVSRKTLVQEGVFENVLYNRKSGAKAGKESTGNGFKPDVTADIGTGVTNVILSCEGETHSREELLLAAEGGIYITKIEGMFAGGSTRSGEFSLLASGNKIVDGQIGTAVSQFTISGNIFGLWKDIEMIGDDPDYKTEAGTCVVSPSVKVKELMVSGE